VGYPFFQGGKGLTYYFLFHPGFGHISVQDFPKEGSGNRFGLLALVV